MIGRFEAESDPLGFRRFWPIARGRPRVEPAAPASNGPHRVPAIESPRPEGAATAIVSTSNPPVPSVRCAQHCPAVAQRQPMVAQPFKAGRGLVSLSHCLIVERIRGCNERCRSSGEQPAKRGRGVPECRRHRRAGRRSSTGRWGDSDSECEKWLHEDRIICVLVPALKGWANIGRRFATTGSWPLTSFAMEHSARTNEFGSGRLDENQVGVIGRLRGDDSWAVGWNGSRGKPLPWLGQER